jgi:hypothetical protein
LPQDVLHRDEVAFADFTPIDHLADAGVIQLHRELGFIDEHRRELFVSREKVNHLLDGDDALGAFERDGLRAKDLGHPAGANAVEEEVLSKLVRFFHNHPRHKKGSACCEAS